MRTRTFVLIAILSSISAVTAYHYVGTSLGGSQDQCPTIHVYFSPNGNCTTNIVSCIANAKSTILVQAYSFTSAPIAEALTQAHKRRVHIQVILDKSQRTANYSSATFLFNANIPVYIDTAHAIAHNKIMVIDDTTVITGSFNFTTAAENKNAENLLIIQSPPLAKIYTANFNHHLGHSQPYERPEK